MKIRLTLQKDYAEYGIVSAIIVKTGHKGSLDIRYIKKRKMAELKENGFAYVNQPPERVV